MSVEANFVTEQISRGGSPTRGITSERKLARQDVSIQTHTKDCQSDGEIVADIV